MDQTPNVSHYILWYVLSYVLIAGLAYLLTTRILTRRLTGKKLGAGVDASQIRLEAFHSTVAILIYVAMTFLTTFLHFRGYARIYIPLGEYSLAWYFASYVVVLALHDTYFYWTHRWMHHPSIFGWLHRTHHISRSPSPFTAHSFHFLEAIVQAVFFVAIALLIPLHWSVFLIFYAGSTLVNVYGHVGYDLLGRFRDRGFFLVCNHPSSHQWHHEHFNGNYGLYFNLWDRLMGTYRGHLNNSGK